MENTQNASEVGDNVVNNPEVKTSALTAGSNDGATSSKEVTPNVQPNLPASKFNDLLGEDGKFIDNWTSKLPDGFKEHEKTLGKFKDPQALMSSYVSLEKMYSQKANEKIKLPGDEATDEDWAKYREAVGAPSDKTAYGLKRPEDIPEDQWNGELADKAASVASKYGIPPKALNELVEMYNGSIKGIVSNAEKHTQAQVEATLTTLKTEWGVNAKNNFQKAERAAIALGLDPGDPDIGNNAEFVKALLKVDSLLGEDKGLIGNTGNNSTYQEQYDKLIKSDDYLGKNGMQRQMEVQERIKGLWAAMRK